MSAILETIRSGNVRLDYPVPFPADSRYTMKTFYFNLETTVGIVEKPSGKYIAYNHPCLGRRWAMRLIPFEFYVIDDVVKPMSLPTPRFQ